MVRKFPHLEDDEQKSCRSDGDVDGHAWSRIHQGARTASRCPIVAPWSLEKLWMRTSGDADGCSGRLEGTWDGICEASSCLSLSPPVPRVRVSTSGRSRNDTLTSEEVILPFVLPICGTP